MENLTREQVMTDSVITHIAKRKHAHKVWLNRQNEYQKIKEQDCYGYKSAKVQNVGRACARSNTAR